MATLRHATVTDAIGNSASLAGLGRDGERDVPGAVATPDDNQRWQYKMTRQLEVWLRSTLNSLSVILVRITGFAFNTCRFL